MNKSYINDDKLIRKRKTNDGIYIFYYYKKHLIKQDFIYNNNKKVETIFNKKLWETYKINKLLKEIK